MAHEKLLREAVKRTPVARPERAVNPTVPLPDEPDPPQDMARVRKALRHVVGYRPDGSPIFKPF